MIRNRAEQNKINADIDRRLREFQTPKEIANTISASSTHVFNRVKQNRYEIHRITREERDHLLKRRLENQT